MSLYRKAVSSVNVKFAEENDSYILFTLPTRVISIIFGLNPVKADEKGFRFSFLHFCFCTILVVSTSLARIFLTPPESRSTFFYQVVYYKQILMPATCILSYFIMVLKMGKLMKYFEETMALKKFVSQRDRKRLFFFQIGLIVTAFSSFIFANVLMYLLAPALYHVVPQLLDIHLSMTLWVIKLQFYIGMIFLWNVLLYVRRSITNLPKRGRSFLLNTPEVDFNAIEVLFDRIVYQAESLNDCYEVALGIASILTALNCITTAYFHVMRVDDASGTFLLVWLAIDFAQQWMVLSAAEIFMNEACKFTLLLKLWMIYDY